MNKWLGNAICWLLGPRCYRQGFCIFANDCPRVRRLLREDE